jgi:hypothetical protein
MEKLIDAHHRLLEVTDLGFKRYLYGQINWQHRLIAILGARGTGKTTLMLQRIKEMQAGSGILYVSADNIHFSNETLLNLAERFHALGGTHLFIDEIHKYPNWSQEVKNIYDSIPRLNLVITGSSVIDMLSGYGDLSRRSVVYHLHGLSLREYIGMKHGDTLPTVTRTSFMLSVECLQPLLGLFDGIESGIALPDLLQLGSEIASIGLEPAVSGDHLQLVLAEGAEHGHQAVVDAAVYTECDGLHGAVVYAKVLKNGRCSPAAARMPSAISWQSRPLGTCNSRWTATGEV